MTLAPKRELLGLLARTPQALHSRARVLWWRLQQAVSVTWHQVHSSGPCMQACWSKSTHLKEHMSVQCTVHSEASSPWCQLHSSVRVL